MKFLCLDCDEGMNLMAAEGPEQGSLSVSFACPNCGHKVAMLTNPEETNLVRVLGVQVGGDPGPGGPMAHVRATLGRQRADAFAPSDPPSWTAAATERLERVPPFARPMARKHYEDFASSSGIDEITPAVMDEAMQPHGGGPHGAGDTP